MIQPSNILARDRSLYWQLTWWCYALSYGSIPADVQPNGFPSHALRNSKVFRKTRYRKNRKP